MKPALTEQHYPSGVYAVLKTPAREYSVLIDDGDTVQNGLRVHALGLRAKASHLLRDAEFIEEVLK